jgi:uncharacterized protein with FMN-binding domain
MEKFKEKVLPWLGFLPMVILAICVSLSLNGYSAPVYTVNAAEMKNEESSAEESKVQESSVEESTASLESVAEEGALYVDGTYTGTGKGFGGTMTVQVVIKDGKISSVTILNHKDGDSYIKRASSILSAIVSKQSTNVDTVSGATYSSVGIIEATRNALSKAMTDGATLEETSALPETSAKTSSSGQGSKTVSKVEDAAAYKDGVYYGTGTGFGGQMQVKVTIKNGKISKVEIVSHKDGTSYINKAKSILSAIVKKQSTNVDTVSGATYSSVGIIQATRNALNKAATNSKATVEETTTTVEETTTKEVVKGSSVVENSTYKDGTYTGTGTGFGGELEVKVTVKNGKITKITVVSTKDDKQFFDKAKTLLDQIVKKQSTNIDTVSGATYSSAGLIEAVRNALSKAETKETEKTTEKATESTTATTIPQGKFPYKDGIYYGTDEGFKGDITVGVVIKNQTIKEIVITESEDDDAFLSRAKSIIDEVLQTQKTNVDVVSGATFSSNGILGAIKNALAEAKRATEGTTAAEETTTIPETTTVAQETTKAPETTKSEETTSATEETTKAEVLTVYKDGTYRGEATCVNTSSSSWGDYTLSLYVTIVNDKITAITNIKGSGKNYISDNDSYVEKASYGTSTKLGMVAKIIAANSTSGVDAVSRATCSSNAIVVAVNNALTSAKR